MKSRAVPWKDTVRPVVHRQSKDPGKAVNVERKGENAQRYRRAEGGCIC